MNDNLTIYTKISEGNSEVPSDIFCELNDVDGIIRIPEAYFPSLKNGQSVMHVDPNNDDHAEGDVYMILPIKNGCEDVPLLLPDDGFRARCSLLKNGVDVEKLEDFKFAPEHLNSQTKIKRYLKEQYVLRGAFLSLYHLLTDCGGISVMHLERIDDNF